MKKSLIIILVAVLPVLLFAQARDFFVDGQDKRDLVTFTSHAPLETVEGKTSHIIGFVNVDPADISTAKAKFVVELATLKTGIGMRDRHMRENHLETDKYPEAVFELDHVVAEKGNDITDGQPADITLIGNFTVHGVTKPIEVKAQVQYFKDGTSSPANLPGEIIRIDAEFTVMLPDYKIERPRFLIMKLDEKQEVNVDVWASTELPKVDL